MNVVRTLRSTFAPLALGSIAWCGVSDHNKEAIRDTAVTENRSLTQAEFEKLQTNSLGFYLGIVSIPTWGLCFYLDERKNKSSRSEAELPDYQI